MTTPNTTLIDGLLDEAVRMASQDVTGVTQVAKTSSAPAASDREKLSAFKQRNEDAARLGVALTTLGDLGFQKVAMEESTHGVAADTTGLPSPTTLSAISEELKDSPSNTVTQNGMQPTTYIPASHDEKPPDIITPKSNADSSVASQVVNGEGAQGVAGEKKDLADGSANQNLPEKAASVKVSSTLSLIAGNKRVTRAQLGYAASLGLNSPEACMEVFVKSAQHRDMDLVDFIRASEFNHPTKRDLFRTVATKMSFAGPAFEEAVASAKSVAEAAVKATGVLPTASDVANSAKVDPLAATAGLFEVGEFIAAVGGQVGSAATPIAAAMSQEAPVPAAAVPPLDTAAAVAPTPGEMPPAPMPAPMAAPMAPPMGGMDPAMGGAPAGPGLQPGAPMDPAMGGMDPAMGGAPPEAMPKAASAVSVVSTADKIAAMHRLIDLRTVKSSNAPVVTDREDTSGGGGPTPKEQAVEPSSKITPEGEGVGEGSASYEMSASEREVADMLSTNQGTVNAGIEEENKIKADHSQELVSTSLEGPSDHGLTGSSEPVKGNMEGNLPSSSSIGSGGGQSPSTPAVDKSSGDEMLTKLRLAASQAIAEHEKESQVMMATGRGTQEISGSSTGFSGQSDQVSTSVGRARDFAADHLKSSGEMPSVDDVMSSTSTSLDEAKKGISLASTAG